MTDIETALKAACVKLALKGCPSDEHCYHAGHHSCEKTCWECWQDDLLEYGGDYIRAHIKLNPEDFVPRVHASFGYEPESVWDIMAAAEITWRAEYRLRLHAAINKYLREHGLRYADERIIKRCHKAVLKSMPDLEETVQAKYREYADECDFENDIVVDDTPVGTKEDPFGN